MQMYAKERGLLFADAFFWQSGEPQPILAHKRLLISLSCILFITKHGGITVLTCFLKI